MPSGHCRSTVAIGLHQPFVRLALLGLHLIKRNIINTPHYPNLPSPSSLAVFVFCPILCWDVGSLRTEVLLLMRALVCRWVHLVADRGYFMNSTNWLGDKCCCLCPSSIICQHTPTLLPNHKPTSPIVPSTYHSSFPLFSALHTLFSTNPLPLHQLSPATMTPDRLPPIASFLLPLYPIRPGEGGSAVGNLKCDWQLI